jgi:hypothetical protein
MVPVPIGLLVFRTVPPDNEVLIGDHSGFQTNERVADLVRRRRDIFLPELLVVRKRVGIPVQIVQDNGSIDFELFKVLPKAISGVQLLLHRKAGKIEQDYKDRYFSFSFDSPDFSCPPVFVAGGRGKKNP